MNFVYIFFSSYNEVALHVPRQSSGGVKCSVFVAGPENNSLFPFPVNPVTLLM